MTSVKLKDLQQHFYIGSVGITSPRLYDVLSEGWHGPHPVLKDKKYPLRNLSSQKAYKLIHLNQEIDFSEQDVSYLAEEYARLLSVRDTKSSKKEVAEINEIAEASKIPGKEIKISYGTEGKAWLIPANDETMSVLVKAFDLAARQRTHIAVEISSPSHDAAITNVYMHNLKPSLKM